MKKLLLLCLFIGSMFGCSKDAEKQQATCEVDEYGVEIGTIADYHGTGCIVTIDKQSDTRSGIIDEVYEFTVDKQEKGQLRFLITMEEVSNNQIVITQFDEFWNEIVSITFTKDGIATGIAIGDENDYDIMTRGWFNNFWNCSKARYREIEEVIEKDDDVHLWCGIADIWACCTISSLAITAIDCF